MENNPVLPPELSPFPPYQGVDNDYSGASMYENLGEVVRSNVAAESTTADKFQFEISVTEDTLVAEAGSLGGFAIAEATEEDPDDGTWYYVVRANVDYDTGVVTGVDSGWLTEVPEDTLTAGNTIKWFYYSVGSVTVSSGTPDSSTIDQSNYGPLLVVTYGAAEDRWEALIF